MRTVSFGELATLLVCQGVCRTRLRMLHTIEGIFVYKDEEMYHVDN